MDSSQMAQVASKYGFTHTPGNGNDFFSHGDILVVRDGLVYDIMVMGVHKSSIRSEHPSP